MTRVRAIGTTVENDPPWASACPSRLSRPARRAPAGKLLGCRVRHLADEALDKEHVLGVANRASRAERYVRVLKDRTDAVARERWRHGSAEQVHHQARLVGTD